MTMSKKANSKYDKTFLNTIMLYILAFAKIVFPLLTLPYLTRVLSVETYGAITYTKSIITYAQITIDFGFLLSSVKDIVRANKNVDRIASIVGDTILAKLLLALVAFFVIVVLSFIVPILKAHKSLLLLSFLPPFLSCFLLDFLFRGIEKMHIVSLIYVLMKTISTCLTILLIKGDSQVLLVPIFDTISSACAILITWLVFKKMGFSIRMGKIKNALKKIKESFLYFTNSVASSAFGALNTAAIGICIENLQDVAYWGVAMQLIGAVQTMYTPLSNGIYPYMVKNKDLSLIKKVLLLFVPFVILGTVLVGVSSPMLLTIVGGIKYAEASIVFRMLLPVLVLSFVVAILGWPTLGAIEKIKEINLSTLAGAFSQILGLAILYVTSNFTIVNVAILRNFSEFFMCASLVFFTIKHKKLFQTKE